ncbi:MAG: CoA-binding protein [Comamonadaceae bacterium CG_4_10_14_3_um_filter_60_42]|nr:MAG: CoA-binding protein [Comamonadaceae bacterium CG_4_10_14_3_um_filter_60_42]
MSTDNNTLRSLLRRPCTIAVVGLSNDPARPSNQVAQYLQQHEFRVVPVNPRYAATSESVLGEPCYASLGDIPFAVDIVDVFRRTEDVLPIAEQAVQIGAKCLWQQIGVANREADALARAAGLDSVMNLCIKIEHARLAGAGQLG